MGFSMQEYWSGVPLPSPKEELESLESLLMKVKEEIEKAGLKFNIIKLKLWHQVPSFHVKQKGKGPNSDGFYFLGLPDQCRR